MLDYRTEVPAWAFINAEIIQEAVHRDVLVDAIHHVEQKYGLPLDSLRVINPAHVLSLLYCLIVVPKELWLKNEKHPVFDELNMLDLLRFVTIRTRPPQFDANPAFQLLRHLRNAVSHVNFAITDSGLFIFWDQKPGDAIRLFEADMTVTQLEQFLSLVGTKLANLRMP